MKRVFSIAALVLLTSVFCAGTFATTQQSETDSLPPKVVLKKFWNISYSSDWIRLGDALNLENASGVGDELNGILNGQTQGIKNNWGVSLIFGRTFAFHKKPIGRFLTIGLDAVFVDINYSNYTLVPAEMGILFPGCFEEKTMHKAEYSFQVGPSFTFTPGNLINLSVYARYAPTFSAIMSEDNYAGNYAHVFVGGASIAFGKVGIGAEARIGSCEYKKFGESDDFSMEGGVFRSSGYRLFLHLRF